MSNPLGDVFNVGPLSFQLVPVKFDAAGVEVPVPHGMGVPAIGSIVVKRSGFCKIRDSETPAGQGALNLISDTAGVNVTVLLIGSNLVTG